MSGFCPALSRLLSFHPDCSDCSAGRSVGVVLTLFLVCLQFCSAGINEVGGCWCLQRSPPSVGIVSLLRVSQKLFHCLSFASLATFLNTSVFSSMSSLIVRSGCGLVFLATISPLSACESTLPGFPCSTRVAGWRLSVMDLLCDLACELEALTSHLCLTYHTGTDIGVSVLAQSQVSVD